MADRTTNAAAAQTGVRIDPQHSAGPDCVSGESLPPVTPIAAPDPQVLAAVSGRDPATNASQLSRQASQIAGHLRTRQRQLDARESNLNASFAGLDNELRSARLYLHDREQTLDTRESKIEQQAKRSAADREDEQNRRKLAEIECAASRLELRQRQLEEADTLLRKHFRELAEETAKSQESLQRDRDALQAAGQRLETERRDFQQHVVAANATLEERRRVLAERGQAAKQMRAETFRLYQEALEQRFATEQAWQALELVTSRGERSQALRESRQRLDEYLELEKQEVCDQRQAVEALAEKLDERAEELRRLRRESKSWLSSREADLEEQAARLVAREVELDQTTAEMQQDRDLWLAERRELESQIRRLLTNGGGGPPEPRIPESRP